MIVREISIEEYTKFTIDYSYSSVLQTKEYAQVMKNQGYTPIFIGIFNNNTIIGASLILIEKTKGYRYAYAPKGFLIDYSDREIVNVFSREVKRILLRMDVIAIKIAPPIIRNVINSEGKIIGVNPKFEVSFNNLKDLGYHHFGFNSLFEAYKPRFEAIIDLSIGYEKLFANIKKEYRTKIRSAERKGIKIYRANSNEIDLIYEQTKSKYPRDLKYFQDSYKYFSESNKMEYYYSKLDTNKYLEFAKKEYEEAEKKASNLNTELISKNNTNNKLLSKKMEADYHVSVTKKQLIFANELARDYQKGLVLSSMLIAKNKSEVYLYMDGFDVKYKNFNAKHLLMWKIIEKYSSLGYKRLNLGGITDIRVKNEKYRGLNDFKTNFNCAIVEYAGDFELVVNQAKYFLYRQIIGK